MMKYLFALCVLVALAGCGDQYRYACQDPANWETPKCKRPTCAVSGTCPDQLITPETMKDDAK